MSHSTYKKATLNKFELRHPTSVDKLKSKFAYLGRAHDSSMDGQEIEAAAKEIRENGYLILPSYLSSEAVEKGAEEIDLRLRRLEFTSPTLGQNLIDRLEHKYLIDNNLYGTPADFLKQGIAFENESIGGLEEALIKYRPSTLTLPIKSNDRATFSHWLDPFLLQVISSYMGLLPFLTEAYIRRNYPADFQTMNHFWHRDLNHPFHLLKVFIFFSDCTLKTGPHEFITGSHRDFTVSGKRYFSESEVTRQPGKPIKSVVKAGTVIIEDTRGLHRACSPEQSFRDLGYAVFMPQNSFRRKTSYYSIDKAVFDGLSDFQRRFVPKTAIVN